MMRVVGDWLRTVWLNARKALRRVLCFRKVPVFGLAARRDGRPCKRGLIEFEEDAQCFYCSACWITPTI